MLTHPTIEKLCAIHLWGMAKAFEDQHGMPALSFEERFGLLVDQEVTERKNRQVRLRLKKAHLRMIASLEDLDYRSPRGVDKALMRVDSLLLLLR